ncbi:MAG TPA: YraN family protein [Opitutaceae bacterium]|nr:YraN family protein [Opitutaceae bacterium]
MFSWVKSLFERSAGSTTPTGAAGERAAEEFLRRERGFSIVTRNWRSPRDRRDEIDLVCRDGGVLVFVEVKTRAAGALVPGYYTVDARKKKVLRRACTAYLRALAGDARPQTFRLDVVEVAMPGGGGPPEVRHFENVPLFPKSFGG